MKSIIQRDKFEVAVGSSLLILSILILFFHYMLPVQDSDLWFHLSYGQYFLKFGTIIPDHTLFSWTPVDNSTIYCTWLPDILFYLLYQAGNLPLLFIFRYFGAAFFLFLFWFTAYRRGIWMIPIVGVASILSLLMSKAGIFLKPELFSYIFMSLSVWLAFKIKQQANNSVLLCYLLPAIMLVWVNSHGAFIFGVLFIFLFLCGEILNILTIPKSALTDRIRKHLVIAVLLAFSVILLTPYGMDYPKYLLQLIIDRLFHSKGMVDYANIQAYQPVYKDLKTGYLFYVIPAGIMQISLILMYIRKKGLDWTILLSNICFGIVYFWLRRSTYFFAPVFAFSFLYMLAVIPEFAQFKKRNSRRLLMFAVVLLSLGIFLKDIYSLTMDPSHSSDSLFGITYQAPVAEAQYIKDNFSVEKIGNTYNNGSYLIWQLWPESKVMIDQRYFPYKKWFKSYEMLVSGIEIEAFVQSSDCRVWCVDYYDHKIMRYFLDHPQWEAVFFGASSVVFVDSSTFEKEMPVRFDEGVFHIKNFELARRVFLFQLARGDYESASIINENMLERFHTRKYLDKVKDMKYFLDGLKEKKNENYLKASELFEKNYKMKQLDVKQNLKTAYHFVTYQYWRSRKSEEAFGYAQKALALDSEDIYALYNSGVIGWYLESKSLGEIAKADNSMDSRQYTNTPLNYSWKQCLEEYLRQMTKNPKITAPVATKIAREILLGQYSKRPPVLTPEDN